MRFRQFLDRYALIIAMVLGALGYQYFRHLDGLMPPLIFLMLFFTFCKINPVDLRLRTWHWIVLGVQLLLTITVYFGIMGLGNHLLSIDEQNLAIISQGIMMCLIMPTATAAPIIAGKLGGSIQNLTTFSLLSNIANAIIVPAFFPIVNPTINIEFLPAMWQILCKIAPLLLGPFVAAWLLLWFEYEYKYTKNKYRRVTIAVVILFAIPLINIIKAYNNRDDSYHFTRGNKHFAEIALTEKQVNYFNNVYDILEEYNYHPNQ